MDTNLLVEGNIPAGQSCPFLGHCKFRVSRRPTAKSPKTVPYSCAVARLHAMVAQTKIGGSLVAKAKEALDNPPINYTSSTIPAPFNGDDVVILDDDGYMD